MIKSKFILNLSLPELTSGRKHIPRMESAKDMGPNLLMIILDQKQNIKRLYKILLLRPSGINVMKYCIMNTKPTRENIFIQQFTATSIKRLSRKQSLDFSQKPEVRRYLTNM